MDIRAYFQKLRETERSIVAESVVVMSQQTSDGGKAGRLIEVSREVAAQHIVEGRARLATDSESEEYRSEMEQARSKAEQQRLAGKVQFTLLSEENMRSLKSSLKPKG